MFSTNAKNEMLDGLTVNRVRLHSGDPGAAGANNQIAGTYQEVAFDAAASGARALSADEDFTGLTPSQSITWASIWDDNGGSPVHKGNIEIASGDVAANAAGEYSLTTSTQLTLTDPA